MRFCLVSTQQHWGGGESLLASIGSQWIRAGHSVSCIVRHNCEVEQHALEHGATILHATKKRGSNLSDWWAIRRVLRDWSPDVVVLNDSHAVPLVGSAALFCRQPRPLRLAFKHTVFRLNSALKYRLLCDKMVCVSQAAMQVALDGGLPAGHAEMIHGGCQPLASEPRAREEIRTELQLAPTQRLLVSVGNLLECKGHGDLIEAMAMLTPKRPDLVAVIAGQGGEQARLEDLIASRSLERNVRLLGYRHDAQRLLDAADVVVHPSLAEGLSLVLIQAQMLGKPIVATAVGGAQEVLAVGTDECSSWIAEPSAPGSLAARITEALAAISDSNPSLELMLQATAARTREQFSVATTAQKWIDMVSHMQDQRAEAR